MTNTPPNVAQTLQVVDQSHAQVAVAPLTPYKYSLQMKDIVKCPSKNTGTGIGMGYRFAYSSIEDERNYLPIALLSPQRVIPGRGVVSACCEAWSLSMYVTLETLQDKARKATEASPMFLKRVGECFTQIKLTPVCGEHTQPNAGGHFEFFERMQFQGRQSVVGFGKLVL